MSKYCYSLTPDGVLYLLYVANDVNEFNQVSCFGNLPQNLEGWESMTVHNFKAEKVEDFDIFKQICFEAGFEFGEPNEDGIYSIKRFGGAIN